MKRHLFCACAVAALAFSAAPPAWAHEAQEHGTAPVAGNKPQAHVHGRERRKSRVRTPGAHRHHASARGHHSHSHGPGGHSHGEGDHAHGDHAHGPGEDHGHGADRHDHGPGGHEHGTGGHDHDHGIETEHLFGFTEGSTIHPAGTKTFITDFVGRFSKRGATFLIPQDDPDASPLVVRPHSSYAAVGNTTVIEYSATDWFSFALGPSFAYHSIRNIEGLQDRTALNWDGLGTEFKFRLLDINHSPVGFAFSLAPRWNRVDEVSGERVETYSLETRIMADTVLIPDRLFAAVNLSYEPSAAHVRMTDPDTGLFREWERESNLEASVALALKLTQRLFVGAEARYLTRYQGTFFDQFEGRAWFVGPTLFAELSERLYVQAAWSFQVSGHAADEVGQHLDLVNYERQQARLQIGLHF